MNPLWMLSTSLRLPILAVTLLTTLSATAEHPIIKLNNEDQQRLGIRFENVIPNSPDDGFHVPAKIIDTPEQRSQIAAYFGGAVNHWYSSGGEEVQQGQVVASLASAELMLLQEQWLAASNNLSDMQQQLNKDQQLLADGVISEQRLRQTQRAYRQADFSLQARRQLLLQTGINKGDLDELQNGKLAPGNYRLRAPRKGVLSRRAFAVGDQLAAGQIVATVTNASTLWLRAQIPLTLAAQVKTGDTLSLADSDTYLTLMSKNSELTPSTQRVEVLARFNQPSEYFPGQQVTLVLPAGRSGFRIPAAAVIHSENATQVYIKHSAGIEARELTLTPMGRDYLATDNINGNEQLVIQGSAQLKGIQLGLGGGG